MEREMGEYHNLWHALKRMPWTSFVVSEYILNSYSKAYTDKKRWKDVILKYPFVKENTSGHKALFYIFNII